MKVLVVGGGGREHALCVALARSESVEHVVCAPGNGGIAQVADCISIMASDTEGLLRYAKDQAIDLTVIGPEGPLVAGIVDAFEAEGLRVYGPTEKGAQLEGSKTFCKELLVRHNIPTAAFRTFVDPKEARDYVEQLEYFPVVVKADGLAAGKGVLICETTDEALAAIEETMVANRFGDAGDKIVIEEFLRGEEASIHAVTDGETLVVLPTSQDHKRVGDGDTGLNTGGMGAYSPAPIVEGALLDKVIETILVPTLHGLKREGITYRGTLYAGLMITKGGPRVLEYNCRFGDPETQVILPRLRVDLGRLLASAADGTLKTFGDVDFDPRAAVGVVIASGGYPGQYQAGKVISGLDAAGAMDGVEVYHAGTRVRDGEIVTAGGRVLCVTALGEDHQRARDEAYKAVSRIRFDGAYSRSDIANRALGARAR